MNTKKIEELFNFDFFFKRSEGILEKQTNILELEGALSKIKVYDPGKAPVIEYIEKQKGLTQRQVICSLVIE